jgi:hypothetical protein
MPQRTVAIAGILCLALLASATAVLADDPDSGTDSGGRRTPEDTPPAPVIWPVQALTAIHRSGQTFLTWTPHPGTGWTYRIYRSSTPLIAEEDLASATVLWAVGDSSALNRRMSRLLNGKHAYAIDSVAGPLDPAQGLCVVTPTTSGRTYYAVTSTPAGKSENRRILVGSNALLHGVVETVAAPRPVFQRRLVIGSVEPLFYTLWASHVDTPEFPAMASQPGMTFDCALTPGAGPAPAPLLIQPHQRGGSLLNCLYGSGMPREWVLALDDPLPNGQNSFWFGYHPEYDLNGNANLPPIGGEVVPYTFRRVRYTLDWAMQNFPLDPARVYAFGVSMGGIGSLQLALWLPHRIAAVLSVVGKYDFSFLSDPDPTSGFNTGAGLRVNTDRMWGTVASNLPQSDGGTVYGSLNLGTCVRLAGPNAVPPIIGIEGKRDYMVGWAEKLGFYEAMRSRRRGGTFFWGPESHNDVGTGYWSPLIDRRYLYRFRSDRSFPALSNCDFDDDPGDGHFASGDTIGTINGYAEWDTTLTDTPEQWEVTLRLRDLPTRLGTRPAPESCLVDVTPSRLQQFEPSPYEPLAYRVVRLSDLATVQTGEAWPGAYGRFTIPGVRVYRGGTRLWVGPGSGPPLDAPGAAISGRLALRAPGQPLRGPGTLFVVGARAPEAGVEVFDLGGRRVWSAAARPQEAQAAERRLELPALPPGVYHVRALAAGEQAVLRLVVLH